MKKYFIILLYLALVSDVDGQVVQVNQTAGCVLANLSFSSLENAITGSNPGATIFVCPGTYSIASININKPLKIYGYQQGTSVLNLSSLGKYISITSDNVEIENLTIITSFPVNSMAFLIRGSNIYIRNVTINERFQRAFLIEDSKNVTLAGLYVYETEVAAVDIRNSYGIKVENSTLIQKSTTSNLYNEKYISLYNVSSSVIRNNNIFSIVTDRKDKYDSAHAIYINGSSTGNIFTGNFIRRVSYCVFFDDASSGNLFYNNYFDCGTPPCRDNLGGYNQYNTSKTPGTNIVGGSYIHGNYWGGMLPYDGFDKNSDGIGDEPLPYNATKPQEGVTYIQNGGDWGPLIKQRETSPPVIFSINLKPNHELRACTLLNVSATSYNQTIAGCTLHINNQTLGMNLSQGSYISHCTYRLCPAEFSEGYASYYVEVKDSSNNTGTSEHRGLYINRVPTVINVISPANNAFYNTTTIALNVTSDNTITLWMYNLNGSGNVTFNPNTTINAQEGSNTLEVYALDSGGFWIYSAVNFTVDTTPPVILVTSPANGSLYLTKNITINATASENVSWHMWINGKVTQNPVFPLNINVEDGLNRVILHATDAAGNVDSLEVQFTVDTSPPYAVPSAEYLRVDVNSVYNLTWTLFDNVGGGYYRVLRNGSIIEAWRPWRNASTVTVPVDTSVVGSYNYILQFNDSSGWMNITKVKVEVVDPNPPNITIISPRNNTYYRSRTITVNATSDRVVHTWWYSINASANKSFTKNMSSAVYENIVVAADGYHLLEIWANSTAGNLSRAVVYFYVDTTVPVINITSPSNITYPSFRIPLRVTADEKIFSWNYSLNGGFNVTFNPNTTIDAQEGKNHIMVYALDRAGNLGHGEVYFSVDTTPPGPVGNLTATPGVRSILLNWTNPPDGDFAGVEVWINGRLNVSLNSTFTSFNVEDLAPATTYTISLRTLDTIGNTGNWSNITVKTLTEQKISPTPAGGGGTNKQKTVKIIKLAEKGKYVIITVGERNIDEIALKPSTTLYYAEMYVEFFERPPQYIKKLPVDKAYIIFKLDLSTKSVESLKIRFRVEKDWLKLNDINPERMKLLQYRIDKWVEIPAKKAGEDETYYIYEAEVESSGYFAVNGERGHGEKDSKSIKRDMQIFGSFTSGPAYREENPEENDNSPEVRDKSDRASDINNKTVPKHVSKTLIKEKGICGPSFIALLSLIPVLLRKLIKIESEVVE